MSRRKSRFDAANVAWRPGSLAVLSLGSLLLTGCFPQVGDPEIFEDELTDLRNEWDEVCNNKCTGSDQPYACQLPPEPGMCVRFDQIAALRCFASFRKAIRLEACGVNNEHMQDLENNCSAVYVMCDEGTTGGMDTDGMDTDGMDTGTGGTGG